MTIDEAIRHCEEQVTKHERQCKFGVSKEGKEYNSQCAADHRQLAEWLTELKDLREENKVLISECDRLIKEKGKLLKDNEDMKNLLRETQPVLRRAFFANYKDTNAANELYDKITEIVGRE
ncbi:hypothetical protein [Ruminococcus sp.]|uniref:hypothetical protein n=1 Tax=Ruminococcus sp. TaxID=41978 RepID=UPI001B493069|nr:hypothetical protein [Ruminococcus sp.]MBP5431574.1 hypothetical protein [Ruminococcus sp.]